MSQDLPTLPDLLHTVREFVDEIAPQLDGRDRYHALCASYLLGIVQRELALGPRIDAEERSMLAHFIGMDSDLEHGYATLARAIRSGSLDERWDSLMTLLLRHVVNKVRVTKPDHLHPMHRAEDAPGDAA
ncbi:MAG TPA: DUF6285 domain-containing protein [Gammaproteobacteria bacterium]|nr:DUF6285 domain-containing protein [Gammaproteobacteria bacterium]